MVRGGGGMSPIVAGMKVGWTNEARRLCLDRTIGLGGNEPFLVARAGGIGANLVFDDQMPVSFVVLSERPGAYVSASLFRPIN
jgi:hypothetical protein